MQSVVIVQGDDRPAREPTAVCDRCGCRGTYARITRHTDPPEVQRFCLRCWPRAHRAAIERRNAETDAWLHPPRPGHFADAAELLAWARGRVSPPGETTAWHWLAAPGTHWRYFRYER